MVVANPPYMGSKNMGPVLKQYVERHYAAGKRDLYAAFMLRNAELAGDGGRVAMVTQQSWMFLRSFADLRAVEADKLEKLIADDSRGLLRDATIETLAHLGPYAFAEISGEVVNSVLFVFAATEPAADHRLTAFRLIGPKSPQEKDRLLGCCARRSVHRSLLVQYTETKRRIRWRNRHVRNHNDDPRRRAGEPRSDAR